MDLEKIFKIAIILKAINGFLELIEGILLFFIKPLQINSLLRTIFGQEIIEDPKDFIANFFINLSNRISPNVELYSAVYLLIHGIIKIGLVYALLKRKLWAYPLSLTIFTIFLIVQAYLLFRKFLIFYLFLSVLDVIIIILVWIEYNHLQKHQNK